MEFTDPADVRFRCHLSLNTIAAGSEHVTCARVVTFETYIFMVYFLPLQSIALKVRRHQILALRLCSFQADGASDKSGPGMWNPSG